MKAVKFLMPWTVGALYNEGEIAGFEDAIAADLIERKIAAEVKAKAKGGEPKGEDGKSTAPTET